MVWYFLYNVFVIIYASISCCVKHLSDHGPDVTFGMALGDASSDLYVASHNVDQAIKKEVTGMRSRRREWSSLIQIPALATVVKRPIHSVYTDQVNIVHFHGSEYSTFMGNMFMNHLL